MGILLERDGEVGIGVGLIFREVNFHAGVDISVMGSVFFHFVGDVFKGLPHAVFDHLLFGFFAFLELFE